MSLRLMKNKLLLSSFSLLAFGLSAQTTVSNPQLIESKNGIESYRSAGFENPTLKETVIQTEAPVFDPYAAIQDMSDKRIVHLENKNTKEAEALRKEIEAIKIKYNIK